MDVSKFVNNIKSVSSRRIRSEFAEHINNIYWKDVLWNESYFIASCGGVTVSVLREYIRPLAKVVAGVLWSLKNAIASRQL
jgi:putative transposase